MTTREQRQAVNRANARERRRWRDIKGTWPERDEEYLDWIRSLPCVVCAFISMLQNYPHAGLPTLVQYIDLCSIQMNPPCWNGLTSSITEAAHVGERGLGQKCSDRKSVALCCEHHREGKFSAHRKGKRFWPAVKMLYGIDRDALIAALNEAYGQRD